MRDGDFSTIIQQQKEDEAQKSMEKEQWACHQHQQGRLCFSFNHVLSLHQFCSVSHTLELGRPLKINNLCNVQYVFIRVLFTPSTSNI